MKKLILPVLLGFAALASLPSHAQTSLPAAPFDVKVTLTSVCQLTAPGNILLSYTSFGAAQSGFTPFTVLCTNSLPYTFALDDTQADQLGLTVAVSLKMPDGTTPATGGTQSGATGATYRIYADIAGSQQGTCTLGTCNGSVTRTLTVSY